MSAIAIAVLFVVLALAASATIAASVTKGIAAGREMLAELSGVTVDARAARIVGLPPLRGRREINLPTYPRQAVRLRSLRPSAAAA